MVGKKCAVVNVIPLDPELELIIGKFWISVNEPLVYMSEITTKKNGTIRTQNFYDTNAAQALPSKVTIQVEMKKFSYIEPVVYAAISAVVFITTIFTDNDDQAKR